MRTPKTPPIGSVGGLSISSCLSSDNATDERARRAQAEELNRELAARARAALEETKDRLGRRD